MKNKLIIGVKPKADYCLKIEMGSGNQVQLHMKGRLHTNRFCVLSDLKIFQSVRVDESGNFLVFGSGVTCVKLSAAEIMDMVLLPCDEKKTFNK